MNELWIVCAFVFLAVLLGVPAIYRLIFEAWRANPSSTRADCSIRAN